MFGDLIKNRNTPSQEVRVEKEWEKIAKKVQERMRAKNLYCRFAEEADTLVIEVCLHLTPPLGYIEVRNPAKPVFSCRAGDLPLQEFKARIGFQEQS